MSKWAKGCGPRSAFTMANVGLETSSVQPSPRAMPSQKAVFPAPSPPGQRRPGSRCAAPWPGAGPALPFRLCCLFRIPPWRASCMLFVSKCAQVRAFIACIIYQKWGLCRVRGARYGTGNPAREKGFRRNWNDEKRRRRPAAVERGRPKTRFVNARRAGRPGERENARGVYSAPARLRLAAEQAGNGAQRGDTNHGIYRAGRADLRCRPAARPRRRS